MRVVLIILVRSEHVMFYFFFFKQKTAYEIVSRDWSSDVCSSDLVQALKSVPRRDFVALRRGVAAKF